MEPSGKDPDYEAFLTELLGHDRRKTILANRCLPPPMGCGGKAREFRDALSVKEYTISGLCQACQDRVFGV